MCVFVRKVICVSVCDRCLVSNNRLSVPRFWRVGPQRPGSPLVIGWLLCCEKFTLEAPLCWLFLIFFFLLPIKCGMQRSRRPFEVCCVFPCVRPRVCLCVCVCLSVSLLYPPLSFHTLRSFSSDEAAFRAGTMRPAPCSLISLSSIGLIPSAFSILTPGRKRGGTFFFSRSVTNPPLHSTFSSSTKDFWLLGFFFTCAFCLDVTDASLFLLLFFACFAGEDASPFAFVPHFGQRALLVAPLSKERKKRKKQKQICVTDRSNVELLRGTLRTPGKGGKTQILAPGLKCVSGR